MEPMEPLLDLPLQWSLHASRASPRYQLVTPEPFPCELGLAFYFDVITIQKSIFALIKYVLEMRYCRHISWLGDTCMQPLKNTCLEFPMYPHTEGVAFHRYNIVVCYISSELL